MSHSNITIRRYTHQDTQALSNLRVREEQIPYAVPDALALARSLGADELAFVMLLDDELVGFFFLDFGYAAHHDFCPSNSVGVRMVMVDERYQGQGVATAALGQLPDYIRQTYPQVQFLYLTVNCRNPGAYRCYRNCGFQDTKELYYGGPVGPQHIMYIKLGPDV